ncbi:hypothetical protein CWO89_36395 [Bradyrhizobium sp. Leo170]|nr:hypothetical protein CWO89_36395 [Bradyrhizobium sp. Leo170]
MDLRAMPRPALGSIDATHASHAVARLIDLEAAGDATILEAHLHAAAIREEVLRRSLRLVVVLGPCAPEPWMPEDLWLIRFLGRALSSTPATLVVSVPAAAQFPQLDVCWIETPAVASNVPSNGVARAVDPSRPGLVPPGRGRSDEAWPILATLGGWSLLLPEARSAPGHASQDDGTSTDDAEWLAAFRQTTRPDDRRNIPTLSAGAAHCFAEGGYHQALRLIEAAQAASKDPVGRAVLESQAQAMRIAAMDFAGAAGRPDPDPALSDALLRDLSMSRAWALVMTGKPAQAEPLFAHARRLTKPEGRDPFWLYLLNISALNKHRLGHLEEAFSFEHTIEEALASFDPPDWHMRYINSINLARLYRFAGEYDRAQGYFKSAFAISEGLRSDSDQVYLNLCQSGIEEAMGRLAEALMARFRAALHWLSMPVPEALAPRVARAMSVESGLDLVARVSAHLEGTLTTLLEQIGPPFSALVDVPFAGMPVFRHVTSDPEGPLAMAIGGPGWGLLARQDRPLGDQVRPEQQPLARLVARLVTLLNPDSELSDSTSLILDPCFGTELPTTWCELGALAVRHGCREVRFRDRRMTLDGGQIASAEKRGHIEIGPGVDGLARNDTGLLVTFRRSRQPILVDTADGHLMERALTRRSIPDLAANLACSAKEIVSWARRLEKSGLLVVRPAIDHGRGRGSAALRWRVVRDRGVRA